jgi:RNA polymerase sigma factor (sigma-70 family)
MSTQNLPVPTCMTDLSDDHLLTLTREGDDRAYGELWKRHSGVGTAIARRVTTRIDSADLVSEAFTRMLQAIHNGAGPRTAVRSYLAVAIRSVAATWGRELQTIIHVEQVPEVPFIDHRLDKIDDLHTLDDASAALMTLPERWRTVLWYSEIEGRSNSEIAEIMNLKPTAAAMLTSRARAGLRRAWHAAERH